MANNFKSLNWIRIKYYFEHVNIDFSLRASIKICNTKIFRSEALNQKPKLNA